MWERGCEHKHWVWEPLIAVPCLSPMPLPSAACTPALISQPDNREEAKQRKTKPHTPCEGDVLQLYLSQGHYQQINSAHSCFLCDCPCNFSLTSPCTFTCEL